MTAPNDITAIATMNPELMRQRLEDPNSIFYKNTHLNPTDPLVSKLKHLLEGGERHGAEIQHQQNLSVLGITQDELRGVGVGVFNLYLKFETRDAHGKPLLLDSPEYMAWQGTTPEAAAKSHPDRTVTADTWAARQYVTLKSQAREHKAPGQDIFIETAEGTSRAYNQGLVSGHFPMNYGYLRIRDEDPASPTYHKQPILFGGDGELDVYVPQQCLDVIDKGHPYRGGVIIKSFNKQTTVDTKVYFTTDENTVLKAETYYVSPDEVKTPTIIAGLNGGKPIDLPATYLKSFANDKPQFIAMSGQQFEAWQYALSENAELRNVRPEKWIADTFGSRARFDGVFAGLPEGHTLSRSAYHAIIQREQHLHTIQATLKDQGVESSPLRHDVPVAPLAHPRTQEAVTTQLWH